MSTTTHYEYVGTVPGDVVCSICLKPWEEPTETPCEHVFCEKCINDVIRKPSATCPECRKPVAHTGLKRVTRVLRQQVDRLEVRCTLCPDWKGPRENHADHVQSAHAAELIRAEESAPCGPLQVTAVSEYDSVSATADSTNLFTMLHLEAPTMPEELLDSTRKPVYITAVLDVSGSMQGDKIKLLQQTMDFVIDELKPTDTLSMIAYNLHATVVLPPTKMTTDGQQLAKAANAHLKAGGGTNISDAVLAAFRQLGYPVNGQPQQPNNIAHLQSRRRSSYNDTTSAPIVSSNSIGDDESACLKKLEDDGSCIKCIWLLTDGEATNGITGAANMASALRSVRGTRKDTTLYTFGFGTPHNQELLSSMSETCDGNYYFIKDFETIGATFADCLGALMSVVVKEVVITGTAAQGVTVKRIVGEPDAVDSTGTKVRLVLADVCSEEKKDIVAEVVVPKALKADGTTPQRIFTWDISYTYVLDDTHWRFRRCATVTRPATVPSDRQPGAYIENAEIKAVVQEQRARVTVMDAMHNAEQLAAAGNVVQAQACLAHARQSEAVTVARSCAGMTKELDNLMTNMRDEQSWEAQGKYMMRSAAMEQKHQRSNRMSVTDLANDAAPMYSNCVRKAMVEKSKSKMSSK